jgi:hypothetical protein
MHDLAKATRAARAARNRRHYLRRIEHKRCINVEIGEAAISLLVRLNWLQPHDADNMAMVAAAVRNMLELSASQLVPGDFSRAMGAARQSVHLPKLCVPNS